jgi:hypothetical protein
MRTLARGIPYSLDDEWFLFRTAWRYSLFCTRQLVKSLWLEFRTRR